MVGKRLHRPSRVLDGGHAPFASHLTGAGHLGRPKAVATSIGSGPKAALFNLASLVLIGRNMKTSLTRPLGSPAASPSFVAALEKVIGQLDGRIVRLVRTGAVAAVLAVSAPFALGCNPAPEIADSEEEVGESEQAILGGGQADWAQQQGQHNPTMVSYYGEKWWNYTDCGSRSGCQGVDLYIKLRVKPVAGANLSQKRVGVVYRVPGTTNPVTLTGNYFTTWGNGDEEWHVKVPLRSWQNVVSFNAWYQDGKGNTFFEDNKGELHAIAIGTSAAAIQHWWGGTNVAVTGYGVSGKISCRLADIDWDKSVAMVWTTDDWQTTNWMETGNGTNQWHWAEDQGTDYELWEVDVDIPGSFQNFQYAVVYKHGIVNGAAVYEFWNNNGGSNWVVVRQ